MTYVRWMVFLAILLASSSPLFSKVRFKIHRVKNGETLWSISRKYKIQYSDLLLANETINNNNLKAGKKIKIPLTINKNYYIAKRGDTIWSVARKFSIPPGSLFKANNYPKNYALKLGERIKIPQGIKKQRFVVKNGSNNNSNLKLIWPLSGNIIRDYGAKSQLFSSGILIRSKNQEVKSAGSGKVIFVGKLRGYGLTILIKHRNNTLTVYSSKKMKANVKQNNYVRKGEVIAYRQSRAGITLFFQVWFNNRLQDPKKYLKNKSRVKENLYGFNSISS